MEAVRRIVGKHTKMQEGSTREFGTRPQSYRGMRPGLRLSDENAFIQGP